MGASRAAMAKAMAGGNTSELMGRIWFVLGALLVYRVGTYMPVPGISADHLASMFKEQQGTIVDVFNMFSGGALERFSVFALGIMPYITVSIVMNLLTKVVPTLEQMNKEGASGRRRITQYTRIATVVLATFQAFMLANLLASQEGLVVSQNSYAFVFTTVVTLVSGTMFLMWLGEQITERGIGNGISLIIFAGIVAGLPSAIGGTFDKVSTGELPGIMVLVLLALVVAVIGFVVVVERGQRRITVNYAQRQQGRKAFAAQSSHLPLKLNMAGVIPPIFASSIILFPSSIAKWLGSGSEIEWLVNISLLLQPGQPIYVAFYAVMIVFFCFFYTALQFNPRETADNLKRAGAVIAGVRPGEQTARYIDKILSRLTLAGAIYITAVCLLPEFLLLFYSVPFYFGGTSLLIIVVVVMDFMSQVQAHLMSHQYEGIMKKSNLKGHGRRGI